MTLNILNKEFFKTELGKKLAKKYFGYDYSEKKIEESVDFVNNTSIDDVTVQKNGGVGNVDRRMADVSEPLSEQLPQLEEVVEEPNFKELFPDGAEQKNKKNRGKNGVGVAVPVKSIKSMNNTLELNDLVNYYKNLGLVGEENIACAMTLAAINGSSFGVEGYSGSGKTFVVDKLVENLLPDVYRIQQSSKLAIFNDIDRINGSKFIYIPELQKAMKDKKSPIIEVIKDLTEGKDANRIVTSRKGKGVKEYSIKKGVTIIYTLALENYFKKDEESSRRLIRLRTDSSQEHLDEIHESKAKNRYSIGKSQRAMKKLEQKVKEHVGECIALDEVNIIDPFSEYVAEIIPKTQKSVGYIDHYYSLLDGCAKFHYNQRQKVDINGETYLIVNLEDHYNVFQMYFNEFTQTLKDLATDEDKLRDLSVVDKPNWEKCFYDGCEIMTNSAELKKLRTQHPDVIKDWYDSQVNNNIINTVDYNDGKERVITKINLALGGEDGK